jgi:hypothetical protein
MGSNKSKTNINENINVNANAGSVEQNVTKDNEILKIAMVAFFVTLITLVLVRQVKKYLKKKISEVQITRV